MVIDRDIRIGAAILVVALLIVWAILFFTPATASAHPEFKHPGYPGALAQLYGWDQRYDNLWSAECLWRKGHWHKYVPPTTLHLYWDEAHLYRRRDKTIPKSHTCG